MSGFRLAKASQRSAPKIAVRFYQQDPHVARRRYGVGLTSAERPVKLDFEPCLGPGPTSSRVVVVDYNADLDRVFEPVTVRKDGTGFIVRGSPKNYANNIKFHQVNVWAVITRTLNLLEAPAVFGRRIPWAFPGERLTVLPHAGYWENVYYDRESGALHFFYFDAPNGETVYTCLCHDIITHELGHAVLDGLKPYYNELSSPDTAGFHEYFGDAIAMFSALSLRELVAAVVGTEDRDIRASTLISRIADQFGAALNDETYGELADTYHALRDATNRLTLDELKKGGHFEEHAYSEVLTGAWYDLLVRCYGDILELRRRNRSPREKDSQTRVGALIEAARLTSRLMLRALDYCPPVDLDYLDYARAVLRADEVAYPLDRFGYRDHVRAVFLERGICRDLDELNDTPRLRNNELRNLDVDRLSASLTDAYDFVDANRVALSVPPETNVNVINVYRTRKTSANAYNIPQEIVVEFAWSVDVPLRGRRFGSLSGDIATLWCGGTLVFNRDGNILHYVVKTDSRERRSRLKDYIAYLVEQQAIGVDDGELGLGARAAAHIVTARRDGRRLSMHRSPALRHATR